jgi:hypothetical protein
MDEAGQAVRFFESLAAAFDTTTALRWSFLMRGATEDQVAQLLATVGAMGFSEIEPMADEEQEGCFTLWFAEVCVHTADSFARRVVEVKRFAAAGGLVVSDYSAGWER